MLLEGGFKIKKKHMHIIEFIVFKLIRIGRKGGGIVKNNLDKCLTLIII